MTPADLAALQALVEAVTRMGHPRGCGSWHGRNCTCPLAVLPAAKEALERVEDLIRQVKELTGSMLQLEKGLEETRAQSERDITYWRARAETAEALAVGQESRIARLEEALQISTYGTCDCVTCRVGRAAMEERNE